MTLRIGILGTSWWVDSMYFPAIAARSDAEVVGLCGRTPAKAEELGARWGVPWVSVENDEFLDPDRLDAVIVATSNDSHEPITLTALDRGLHVLCEKPVANTVEAADRMAARAAEVGAITLVPFTYRYMPTNRWVKRLIDDGYVGGVHHMNLRYFTGYGRTTDYNWRYDPAVSGSGVLGDLGSHWLDLARWLVGEIEAIGCVSGHAYERPPRPDGSVYEPLEDSAIMTVRFSGGAYGTLQVSSVCWEGGDFNQTHHLDVHGTDGTVYSLNDWIGTQEVRGLRAGDPGPALPLPIPDDIWGDVRRASVHDTYRDVFRVGQAMTGEWIDAVLAGRACAPDLTEGARVQQLLELAQQSAALDGRLLDALP
ncbi:MAG: Gfo/Idh/MocA family oxidoreductase [Acidimicrobiia bacterium]|nr:Gfo/Idh/MocA family oxidoreductase [Acidimicrobiia bacterium]